MTMAINTVTLYISEINLRLMITRGKRIVKLADVPLDTPLSEIDTPEKETWLADKIKYLFKTNRISGRKIILGLSGLHCLTRPIALPELPKTMLDEAVNREAKRVLPVPVEQLYISWQTVETTPGRIQAFMVAIPRHIADTVIRVVHQAGLKPYMMDIKPLALARLAREPNAIILDVQQSEFDIIVMVNRIPQPIRTVPFSKEVMSLKERLVIVKDELERTVQFYNSNNADKKIQSGATLLISGELADETELYESLGQELGFKTVPLTSPLKCLKQLDPSHHLVNVGLALKEWTRDAGPLLPNFNTLPAPYQPKQISMNRLLAIPATAAAVGLIILLIMTVRDAAASIETARIQLDSNKVLLEKRQAQKKELSNSIASLERQVASVEAAQKSYAAALEKINNTSTKMNGDLSTTVDNIGANINIKDLSIAGTSLSVNGKASSEQEVIKYARDLMNTGRFAEITISGLTRIPDSSENDTTAMNYTLNLKLKDDNK
jgi:type IV pilus assembly protein PilM